MSIHYNAPLSDPGLKVYFSLTQRETRREDVFIAESVKVISYALDANLEPISLLCEQRHIDGKAASLIDRLGDVPVYAPRDENIQSLIGYELSRGVLCAFKRPRSLSPEEALYGAKRCAVMEDVADTTNLGAIFRSAAALGMDALLLSPGCADPLSRRSVRVSMGAVFRLPWARLPELDKGGIDILKQAGFTLCALALTDDSVPITRLKSPKPALLLGNEGAGLKAETVKQCDLTLRIPMRRGIDSLNVAAAAAIAFWEAGK